MQTPFELRAALSLSRLGPAEGHRGDVRQQLAEAQRQLQAQKETYLAEQVRLEARTRELQEAQAAAEERVAALMATLAEESKRREGAEQQAGEIGKRRRELEAELAENKQAQERLRQQLEEVQKQAQALKENYTAEQRKLVENRRPRYTLSSFIGNSPACLEVKRQARRAAQQDTTVLLLGETAILISWITMLLALILIAGLRAPPAPA